MKVHQLSAIEKSLFKKAVVTVGIFDGVHKGHRQVIQLLKEKANEINGETVIATLWPHPRMVLYPDKELKLLTTFNEKIKLLEEQGIDHLVILPFSKDFSKISASQFIRDILLEGIGMQRLIVGFDNHIGHNKEGDFEVIIAESKTYNFEVFHSSAYYEGIEKISSTDIRVNLELGDVVKASSFLGYSYTLSGKVAEGRRLGRTIGFPTANIQPDELKMLPGTGVYAVRVFTNEGIFNGMLNIGFRPTVDHNSLIKTIEVNLFGFEGNLYEKEITVTFVSRLRNEVKFNGIDELKAQLNKDREDAMSILQKN